MTIHEAEHFEKNQKTEEQTKVAFLAGKRRQEEDQRERCKHCQKPSYDKDRCWGLYPEL
jgi:hypothetical protein